MSKSRSFTGSRPPKRPRGRPRILGPASLVPTTAPEMPPSLPPAAPDTTLALPPTTEKPGWQLNDDSIVRTKALQIIAMRIAGMEDVDIAKALDMSPKSISPYVYRAARNGWLDIDNPKERLQYQVMHKVVRNLESALDSQAVLQTGMKESTAVALKVAEGTVFKQFNETPAGPAQQAIVAIKIEMPQGAPQTMREDTIGGLPAHTVEAEVVK